jgi:hypothetical protein
VEGSEEMQIIINFSNISAPSVQEAKEGMRSEYYNRPHTWASGFSRYLKEGTMIGMRSGANRFAEGVAWKAPDEFWTALWAARKEDGASDDQSSECHDKIGGGYHAAIVGERVVWETYHACSGNFAGIRYHVDGSATLFVDSARHGIPELALRFRGVEGNVELYNSLRTDCLWWECGLEHPDVRDAREIPGWKYEGLGEEVEARIA